MQPFIDDSAFTASRLQELADDSFERETHPPEHTLLRILAKDREKEYILPWPYVYRDDDFFAAKTGLSLDDSVAVTGWKLWE
jgi:hypothetical protein